MLRGAGITQPIPPRPHKHDDTTHMHMHVSRHTSSQAETLPKTKRDTPTGRDVCLNDLVIWFCINVEFHKGLGFRSGLCWQGFCAGLQLCDSEVLSADLRLEQWKKGFRLSDHPGEANPFLGIWGFGVACSGLVPYVASSGLCWRGAACEVL